MIFRKRPWEHRTRRGRQLALAGTTPREVYLEHRRGAARELLDQLAIEPNQRGFEIGSGEGIVARELSPHCRHLDCADVSRTFLKVARKTCRGLDNVRFHRIRRDYLDFLPEASYDFGFSLNVFIHLHLYEIYFYFLSVRRRLRPGGLFFFTGATLGEETWPLFHHFAERYRKRRVVTPGFMRWNALETLAAVSAEAGLELLEDRVQSSAGHLKVLLRRPLGE